ncbi:MAG TPA: zinc-ribbon and DUF3426 domain-containing protein [Burkholderiaceae bacterium]|nr:zinc-ribbon and DUF3426 domain-containing protein [Burkholderiaceae bacterium]
MSLATRCAACGTVFRVVQDQLKVSEGWVRCGRCNDVFNALEGLFDLDREAPPTGADAGTDVPAASAAATDPSTGVTATREQDESVALHPAVPDLQDSDESFDPPTPPGPRPRHEEGGSLVERLDGHFFGTRRVDHNTTSIDKRDRLEFSDARFDTDLLGDEDTADDDNASLASAVLESERREMPAPEFLRRAQRAARWQRPRIRLALAAAASLLLVVLALQTAHHFRDLIAARWPQTRGALAAWCDMADCTIGAPRRIGAISVESTSLAQTALPEAFRLSVNLRNRGNLALALPWVELSLTDTGGRLVARRALSGADFRAASTVLQPGAEQALQLLLSAGSAPVSGYTVEIFYP